jgi:hypothetical protein
LKRREEVWKRINLWDSCIVCPHGLSVHLLATVLCVRYKGWWVNRRWEQL